MCDICAAASVLRTTLNDQIERSIIIHRQVDASPQYGFKLLVPDPNEKGMGIVLFKTDQYDDLDDALSEVREWANDLKQDLMENDPSLLEENSGEQTSSKTST